VLKANGSPRAIVIADIVTRESQDSSQEKVESIPDVLKDVHKDVLKELTERLLVINATISKIETVQQEGNHEVKRTVVMHKRGSVSQEQANTVM
jgi:hypothetical protein